MKKLFLIIALATGCVVSKGEDISIKITKKYLNFPISHQVERKVMKITASGEEDRAFEIRLAASEPDYWVFCDMTPFKGKTIKISYPADKSVLNNIYQADEIAGQDSMYKETNRPQIHFTPKRGWHNDPNGLIYYEGEYHLFYQHNPYEKDWGNMHWGHAVSKDLIHWEELPLALYPDEHGTMFSGSTVIDYQNTAGFNKGSTPAMVAIYTADSQEKQVQCVAYSLDKGRTWTKYKGNPVIDSKEKWNSKDTRDPKVFWYAPNNEWVLVLNERDGHSVYTSSNLKEWNYESHITGFWECPELFELPVDGNKNNTKWVMYGASGTYMTGSFDGKKFTPESGKHYYTTGSLYAAQTFTNIPDSDGRRIQIGWGRISHPGMPFNSLMLLPTTLTLHTTKDGVRLFNNPVKEIDELQSNLLSKDYISVKEANELLHPYSDSDCMRIQFTLKLSHATDAGFNLYGQSLLRYDMNGNQVNGVFYSQEDMTSMEITADVIIDKTSVEVFIDKGAYSYSMERKANKNNQEGYHFWGHNIEIKNLKVYSIQSIWK
ncbi:fructan beta-fructosidase [termite gut metagenome]|uniref:Fructan beta-fructosidase n=1 Tax=termite gut metagenome TaxID=433724 RepID=A0A5J4S2I0_9ZZZZ